MSSSSNNWRRNNPVESLEFRNQACNMCGKSAVLKISGSTANPRKAYFKCLDCNNFVMWLGNEHVIKTDTFRRRNAYEDDAVLGLMSEIEELIRSENLGLKMKFEELAMVVKFMSFFIGLFVLFVVVVVMMKV
ncbi:hypothetical protein RND81_03G126500 [Saponaria officinalis]|uniref:Zinc finger GRF-type domain-containing protein n=1 Tax=Saponaria officinalis TaxID=3572 RepID=A0AAW1M787_SAPOF